MKTAFLTFVVTGLVAHALWAAQVPAPPPGTKTNVETSEAEVLKVYAAEDQGAKFRAYAVKYKGSEVVIGDTLARTDKKVGEKIRFSVVRVEMPTAAGKIHAMQFGLLDFASPKKK